MSETTLQSLRLIFGPPSYEDKRRSATAAANFIIGWVILLIAVPVVALVALFNPEARDLMLTGALWLGSTAAILLLLTMWHHETAADVVCLASGWALYVYLCYHEGGFMSPAVLGFVALLLVASYVRGPGWGIAMSGFAVLGLFLIAHFDAFGLLPPVPFESTPWLKAGEYTTYFVSLGFLQIVLSANARRAQHLASVEANERRLAERRLADAIEHAPYSTLVCELTDDGGDFVVVSANSNVGAAGNVERMQLVGKRLTEVYRGLGTSPKLQRIIDAANFGGAFDIERVRFTGLRGERLLDVHVAQLGPGSVALFVRDVTSERDQSRSMLRDALHDPLTGLTNRTLFLRVVSMALANRGRRSDSVAVMFIDLDDFKTTNDAYGHAAGDQLLKAVADRLPWAVRAGDVIARLGGDEFAVLLTDIAGPDDVALIAARVRQVLAEPFDLGGVVATLTASIGATMADAADTEADALLRRADHAMYEVKRSGRDGYHRFEQGAGDPGIS